MRADGQAVDRSASMRRARIACVCARRRCGRRRGVGNGRRRPDHSDQGRLRAVRVSLTENNSDQSHPTRGMIETRRRLNVKFETYNRAANAKLKAMVKACAASH